MAFNRDPPHATGVIDERELHNWSRGSASDCSYSSDSSPGSDLPTQERSLSGKRALVNARPDSVSGSLWSWLQPSYTLLKNHQRRSRYYGWQWGILTGAIAAAIVLVLNLTLIAVGFKSGYDSGIATLLFSDKDTVDTVNTALHLLINICSTLLLSAGNYAMQVLTAPSRADCDRAHRSRASLKVGVMSLSNLRHVSPKKRWLWVALVVSSIPLHLFYNASIFPVAPVFGQSLRVMDNESPEWSALDVSSSGGLTQNISATELGFTGLVDNAFQINLAISQVTVEYFDSLLSNRTPVRTVNMTLDALKLPEPLYTYGDMAPWSNLPNSSGWLRLERNETFIQREEYSWNRSRDANVLLHGGQAIVRSRPNNWNKVSLGLPLIIIVSFSNIVKLAVLVFILLDRSFDPPLVTIGDTIASFLSNPDPGTAKYRNFNLDDFIYETGDAETRTKIDVQKILKADSSRSGQWQPRVRQYGMKVNRHRLLHSDGLTYVRLSAIVVAGAASLIFVVPLGPWGAASQQRSEFPGGLAGQGYMVLALIINSPQLLLSVLYFTLNRICTSIATVHEYNELGIQKKALRVSRPEGLQREKYFLQLPLRFAIPLNSAGAVLHWLASQTLFMVRLDMIRDNKSWDQTGSSAAWGVSGSAYLALIVVLWLLIVTVISIAGMHFTERVPFAGTSSWVISAACHPPASDEEPALQEICWGRVIDQSERDDVTEQFSFSSSAMIMRPEDEQAPRVKVAYSGCLLVYDVASQRQVQQIHCADVVDNS